MTLGTFDVKPSSILKAGLEGYSTAIDVGSISELYAGSTTLHVAVVNNSVDAVGVLLEYGVDANIRDVNGFSPLHYAAAADNNILVEKLLEGGAEPDAPDYSQETPLISAARSGATQAASMLLKHGANVFTTDYVGRTALHYAQTCQQSRQLDLNQAGASA